MPGHPTAPPPHRHTTRVSPFCSGRGHRRGCSRETRLRRAEFSVWASALQVLCSPHVHCAHARSLPLLVSRSKASRVSAWPLHTHGLLQRRETQVLQALLLCARQRQTQLRCPQLRPVWPEPVRVKLRRWGGREEIDRSHI